MSVPSAESIRIDYVSSGPKTALFVVRTLALLAIGVVCLAIIYAPCNAQLMPSPGSIGLLRLDGDFGSASAPWRYGYVVLNAWEYGAIPALKAKNLGIKVLVYKDMASTRSYACLNGVDDALLPAGVGYCDADVNHPQWFLLDTNGGRVEWAGYSGHWQMDVGDAGYQDAWLARARTEVKQHGWDGIFLDNATGTTRWYLSNRLLAKYPTNAEYQAATESFLSHVSASLVRDGLLVFPNITDVSVSMWNRWILYASGAAKEWWTKYGRESGLVYVDERTWDYQMALFEATQSQGKAFIAITYAPLSDGRSMRFARASFLLVSDGGGSSMILAPGAGVDPWSDEWTIDIGVPRGRRYRVGNAWRRDYTAGTVIVNPSALTVEISLGGSYVMPDGTAVASVSLAPQSGLVLRKPDTPTGKGDWVTASDGGVFSFGGGATS